MHKNIPMSLLFKGILGAKTGEAEMVGNPPKIHFIYPQLTNGQWPCHSYFLCKFSIGPPPLAGFYADQD